MSVSYRFHAYHLDSGDVVKRPVLDVVLMNGDRSVEVGALLDSGSDVTSIPKAVADYLGVRPRGKPVKMFGFHGGGEVRHATLGVVFKGRLRRSDERLSSVPVAVVQDPDEEGVVVGTQGVFEHFRIVFLDSKSVTMTRLR